MKKRALSAVAPRPWPGTNWRATIWSSRPLATPAALSRRLAERVRFVDVEGRRL